MHGGYRGAGASGFDGAAAAAASSAAPPCLISPAPEPNVRWPTDLKRSTTVQAGDAQTDLQKSEQFKKMSFFEFKDTANGTLTFLASV